MSGIRTLADASNGHRRDRAAILIAEDDLTNAEIARTIGIALWTLEKWKQRPDFKARVEELRRLARERLERGHISARQYRLDDLIDHYKRMKQVILERAADPAMAAIPGGTTGLMVKTIKTVGHGKFAQTVEEYTADIGLLREMRETMKQAAIERGEWTEKQETASVGALLVRVEYVDRPIGPGMAALTAGDEDGD